MVLLSILALRILGPGRNCIMRTRKQYASGVLSCFFRSSTSNKQPENTPVLIRLTKLLSW